MTAASTLEVVHGLFNNLKEVINGAPQVFFRDVNDRDAFDRTALTLASRNGKSVAQLLIKYGAEVNCPDGVGWSLLQLVTFGGHTV